MPIHHSRERLIGSELLAATTTDTDDDDDPFVPEIVPIAEGEVTRGRSKKNTEWDRDPLERAVEQGVFDNAKLLKGRPGPNPHKPIDEQATPDMIVGSAGTFRYEPGRGPVSNNDGVVTDNHIADLIDNELVEISPDVFRKLGDWDEALADGEGAYSVEEVIACPWMTIVDNGAGANAELNRADAEALAALPRFEDLEGAEQLAHLQFLRFWPTSFPGDMTREDLDAARDAVDALTGVDTILRAPPGPEGEPTDPELLAVLDPDRADLGTLNDDLTEALDDTPFEVGSGYHWLPDLEAEHLAQPYDDTGGIPSDPTDNPTDRDMPDDDTLENLREQLAAANTEIEQQEAQIEDLEDNNEDLEAQADELESEKEALEEEKEDLEDEHETFKRALASKYADESPMSAESARDRLSVSEMVEDLDDGPDDDDDDRTPQERLSEQLAAGLAPRGGTGDPAGGAGDLSDEQEAQAEQLAGTVLSLNDIQRLSGEDITKREYLKREEGIDAAEYGSEDSLRTAIAENGGD